MRTPSDEQVLAWLRQKHAARKSEIIALETLIASMAESIASEEAETPAAKPRRARAEGDGKTTSDYVLDALRVAGAPMTKRELVDALRLAGWQTNASDPSETVRYAIGVLINQGQIKAAPNHTYVLASVHIPDTYTVPQPTMTVVGGTGGGVVPDA